MDITEPVTRHLTRAKFQVPVYRLAIHNGMSIIARACKVYQSVPDYECGCEGRGSHLDRQIVFSMREKWSRKLGGR